MISQPATTRTAAILVALLALAAPFLGGSDTRWSQGLILVGFGALLIFNPPKKSNGRILGVIFALLLAWGLLAFTPASLWGTPWWRTALQNDMGIGTGRLLSPQPWLTLEAWALLAAGCIWFYSIAALDFDSKQRRAALRTYSTGIIILAAIALLFHFEGWTIPFWNSPQNLGPFANRNQMGDLLALGGLTLLACAFHDGELRKKWMAAWFFGLAIVAATLVLNFSRAGLLLFFSGTCLWSLWIMIYSRSPTRIVLALCMILLLAASFFLFGGKSLKRFQSPRDDTGGESIRWLVQSDALRMTRQLPLTGFGLGNFSSVFPWYREKSISQSRAVHPENDWLWLAAEMGWPAVILVVAAVGALAPRWRHLAQHSDRAGRTACLICGLLFAIHGLVDVSGHRLGTMWPALFLFALSLGSPPKPTTAIFRSDLFRIAGLVFIILGVRWVLQTFGDADGPGLAAAAWLKERGETSLQHGKNAAAMKEATLAMDSTPLDWSLYFMRASAELDRPEDYPLAVADFRRARFLEPLAATLPFDEGVAWLGRHDDYALAAWAETLKRAPEDKFPDFYNQMLTRANTVFLKNGVENLAAQNAQLLLIYLQRAPEPQIIDVIKRLLATDPELKTLNGMQKQTFFRIWSQQKYPGELRILIENHPEWQQFAWPGLADEAARRGDYEEAWMMVKNYGTAPPLPVARLGESPRELERAFVLDDSNYRTGFALYNVQERAGQHDEALVTLRKLAAHRDCPTYVHYLEAQLWAEKKNWEKAWQAWRLSQPD